MVNVFYIIGMLVYPDIRGGGVENLHYKQYM